MTKAAWSILLCKTHKRASNMANNKPIKAAVLGASGYTGADMIRLAALHPAIKLVALIAKGHAGQSLAKVFPHLASLDAPALVIIRSAAA